MNIVENLPAKKQETIKEKGNLPFKTENRDTIELDTIAEEDN